MSNLSPFPALVEVNSDEIYNDVDSHRVDADLKKRVVRGEKLDSQVTDWSTVICEGRYDRLAFCLVGLTQTSMSLV